MGVCVKCVYIIPGQCVCDLELCFFVYIANMESLMMKKPHLFSRDDSICSVTCIDILPSKHRLNNLSTQA
jgi:hypothetical protein